MVPFVFPWLQGPSMLMMAYKCALKLITFATKRKPACQEALLRKVRGQQ